MDHVATLIEKYFGSSNGELYIGGVSVNAIVTRYGTPLFIYDHHTLDRKWALLRNTMPPEFDIYYSIKANPNRTLLQYFLAKGGGLEIASGGEFHQALSAGCPPHKMIFAGPGKTAAELELVLAQGIGEIHVESLVEAERIGTISRRLSVQSPIALRINPGGEAQGGAMRMGGKPAPFGIDEEALDSVLDQLLSWTSIAVCGVHLFVGTQILDYTLLVNQYRKGVEIARRVAARLQLPLKTVDFGGGFGIPYFSDEQALDMEGLRKDLYALMAALKDEQMFAGTRFVVEPGRFLVGEAGIYVVRIIDIKVSRGKKFLIVDGGMNHHLAASGNLGQTIKRNFPLAVLNRLDSSLKETVDVVGPLCTPLDILARSVELPKAEVGDLIGIFQSGAYARTASPLGFLSHLAPPEVWVQGERDYLIRRRGTYEDYLQDQGFACSNYAHDQK
jgi:diaminopimelate decarboxylase